MSSMALSAGWRMPHPPVCIADPYFSCDALVSPRTILRAHANDAPTDAYYNDTELILNLDGSAADASPAAHVMVLTGDGAITSTRSLYGTYAYENTSANGASGLLSADSSIAFAGTDSLCFEAAVFATSVGSGYRHILQVGSSGSAYINIGVTAAGFLAVGRSGSFPSVSATPFPLNQWVLVRWQLLTSGTQSMSLYMNGVTQLTGSGALFAGFSGASVSVGADQFVGASGTQWLGSIANVRVTQALRSAIAANYTPAPMALPTALHLTAEDCSCAIPKTLTYTGDATPSPTQFKFGPRAFYIPALATGDVTPNGVVVSDNGDFDFGADDFALRLWAYRLGNGNAGYLFHYPEANGALSLQAQLTTGNLSLSYCSSGGVQSVNLSSTPFPLNTWQFVVLQKRGALWELYLHGVRVDSRAVNGGAASTVTLNGGIGLGRTTSASSSPLNGYIDEIDFLKGVAPYTGDFTPPALPNCCHA